MPSACGAGGRPKSSDGPAPQDDLQSPPRRTPEAPRRPKSAPRARCTPRGGRVVVVVAAAAVIVAAAVVIALIAVVGGAPRRPEVGTKRSPSDFQTAPEVPREGPHEDPMRARDQVAEEPSRVD